MLPLSWSPVGLQVLVQLVPHLQYPLRHGDEVVSPAEIERREDIDFVQFPRSLHLCYSPLLIEGGVVEGRGHYPGTMMRAVGP